MQPQLIAKALAKFNVATIGHFPTRVELMPRLSKHCGGGMLYVKRDDCSGLAFGGNKVRQLSYYFGDALASGADTVLITGAVQSNYVRCTAAAAAKLGLQCHVQLEERVSKQNHAYNYSGNVLLNRLFDASVTRYPFGEDEQGADASLEQIANAYKQVGRKPYVIHLSMGHVPLGALARVLKLCGEIEQLLSIDPVVTSADVVCDDSCLAPGYGQLGEEALSALKSAARLEGIVVDPVYTAKSLACAMSLTRSGVNGNSNTLYLHTGGGPAIFGYEDELTSALDMTT